MTFPSHYGPSGWAYAGFRLPNAVETGMQAAMCTRRIRVASTPARGPTVAGDLAGGVGSQEFGSIARRSGTSIGARSSGPPPQEIRTSPRQAGFETGASGARGLVPSIHASKPGRANVR